MLHTYIPLGETDPNLELSNMIYSEIFMAEYSGSHLLGSYNDYSCVVEGKNKTRATVFYQPTLPSLVLRL